MPGPVVLMPNWIGDYMLALSIIERMHAGRGSYPTLLSPSALAPLAETCTGADVIAYKRASLFEWLSVLKRIRACSFDRIHLLPYSFSSAWFAFWTGIAVRRGIDKDGRGFLLNDCLPSSRRDYTRHILHEYCSVLDIEYRGPEAWPGKQVDADERYRGIVAVCPGATYGPAKRWPYFDKLIEKLGGERIVLLGKKGDAAGLNIAAGSGSHVEDLTGATSLSQVVSIIAAAKIAVSNDSGLMHIAGYVGTPVVGIFGSTSPDWTRPPGKNVRIACNRQPCSPCFERECRYGHCNCLRSIPVEDIERLTGELTA